MTVYNETCADIFNLTDTPSNKFPLYEICSDLFNFSDSSIIVSSREFPEDGKVVHFKFNEGVENYSFDSVTFNKIYLRNNTYWNTTGLTSKYSLTMNGRMEGLAVPYTLSNQDYDPESGSFLSVPYGNSFSTSFKRQVFTHSLWAYKTNWGTAASIYHEYLISQCHQAQSDTSVFYGIALFCHWPSQNLYISRYENNSWHKQWIDTGLDLTILQKGWHLFTMSVEQRYISIYLDDQHIYTYDAGNTNGIFYPATDNVNLAYGNTHSSGGNYWFSFNFTGYFDSAIMWDRVLDPVEIKGIYNYGHSILQAFSNFVVYDSARYGQEYYMVLNDELLCEELSVNSDYHKLLKESLSLCTPTSTLLNGVSSSTYCMNLRETFSILKSLYSSYSYFLEIFDNLALVDSTDDKRKLFDSIFENIGLLESFGIIRPAELKEIVDLIAISNTDGSIFNIIIEQKLTIREKVFISLIAIISEIFTSNDQITIDYIAAIKVAEKLVLSGIVSSLKTSLPIVSVSLAVIEDLLSGKGAKAIDLAVFNQNLLNRINVVSGVLEAMVISSSVSMTGVFTAPIYDNIKSYDTLSINQILQNIINDRVSFCISFGDEDTNYTGWVMNTRTHAVSYYPEYPFNSFTRINNVYYGANNNGLYRLDSKDDDGVSIKSDITLGIMDFTGDSKTIVQECFVAMRSDGKLAICIKPDDNKERWYEINETDSVYLDKRIKVPKGIKSRYWEFTLKNIDGSDFEIGSFDVVPIVLKRRV